MGETVEPVYGQSDINARIMSLEFKDCHAKIRQVDSLETLDKGVVVQVSCCQKYASISINLMITTGVWGVIK